MTIETFFEKFDLFVDAPNAVDRMRELVLSLAMQGKLLGELLRIEADGLPQGWRERQLGHVAQFINGDRSKNYPSKGFRVADGVPFINAGHLRNGDIASTGLDYITAEHFERLGGGKIQRGDVVYCLRGSLGKCAVVKSIDRGAIASSLVIIRPSEQLTSSFLYFFLISPQGKRMIAKYDNGSAQPNLSAANVKKYVAPIPPLAEQKRIVAKVDELMALCDQLEVQHQEREARQAMLSRAALARFADAPTSANLHLLFHPSYVVAPVDIRKTILTLGVSGKLVRQDPNDEPAGGLLRAIRSRAGSERSKKKPCRAFTADETPFEIPATWVWTMLGEITDIGTGSTPSRGEPSFWTNGNVPWITSGATSHSPITEGDELVTQSAVAAHRLRLYPSGTLLVALYGQGKTRGQVASLALSATINQACAAICPLEGTPPMQSYLKLLLEKQYDEIRSQSAGGAQPNLNVQKIKEVFVPLPPLTEQHRIVAKVDELMALVDQLETQLTTGRAAAANLLSAAVAELTSPVKSA